MSEKWYFNETLVGLKPSADKIFTVSFTSNGVQCTRIYLPFAFIAMLYTPLAGGDEIICYQGSSWQDPAYRTIELDEPATGDLLTFLQQNATNLSSGTVDPNPPAQKLINKVVLGSDTVLDLTSDTVTPETLLVGTTAHNAKGETIVGTLVPCTVYSAENPETFGDDYGYFTWTIPASDHGFSSNNILVSIYKSTGEQVLGDVKVSPTDYSVTVGLYYDMSISTYAFRAPSGTNIPAGEFRVIIIGPVQTPAAVQQAMLNQLPVYTGGGNY